MSILDSIKQIFVGKTAETTSTGETSTTKQTETVESKEAQELAEAKTDENEMAEVEIGAGEKIKENLKDYWENENPVGRMITKDENFIEAEGNAMKYVLNKTKNNLEEKKSELKENLKDYWENENPVGRMITKGENFIEAEGNAMKYVLNKTKNNLEEKKSEKEAVVNGFKSALTKIGNFFKGIFSKS